MSHAIAKIIRPADLSEEVFAGADQLVRSTELPNTGCLVVRPNRLPGAGYKLQSHLASASRHIPIIFINTCGDREASVLFGKPGSKKKDRFVNI
jgi:FixJ family two-component response regulator